MLKSSITAQDVCDLLNEMLFLDPKCTNALLSNRVECNSAVANHPHVQVQQFIDDKVPKVGIMGIINGLFGVRSDGMGGLCFETDKAGSIVRFKITPRKVLTF
jgi:hypothetical protein